MSPVACQILFTLAVVSGQTRRLEAGKGTFWEGCRPDRDVRLIHYLDPGCPSFLGVLSYKFPPKR